MQRTAHFLPMVVLLLAGCRPEGPTTVPVTGTITFDRKHPPAGGTIYFSPIEATPGLGKRPGHANFDTSGRYSAESFEGVDGLVPGTYAVRVECWQSPPTMQRDGISFVASNFQPPALVVDVSQRRIIYDLDVASAPPSE